MLLQQNKIKKKGKCYEKKTIKKKISLMYHPAFSDTHSDITRAFLRIRIRGTCNVGQRGYTCWITRERRSNVTGVIARASPNIQEEMSPPSCGSTVLLDLGMLIL